MSQVAGAIDGPVEPFKPEQGNGAVMVVVPLESSEDALHILDLLMPAGELVSGVEAIQVERGGSIEFLTGDGFDRECVSVGPSVPVPLLRALVTASVIGGFYTRVQAEEYRQSRSEYEVLAHLELLSSTDLQLKYAHDVPIANVPAELVWVWFDDLDLPESLSLSFSGADLEALVSFSNLFEAVAAEVEGLSLPDLHRHPSWLRVVAEAGRVLQQVRNGANP